MESITLVASFISIILSIDTIVFSQKESKKSEECYKKTIETLSEIKNISTLNFKATGYTTDQLKDI